jgi:hypothetical protein
VVQTTLTLRLSSAIFMALTTKMAFVIGELWDTLEEAKLGPQSPWLVPQSAQDMGFPTSHLQGPTDEVGYRSPHPVWGPSTT